MPKFAIDTEGLDAKDGAAATRAIKKIAGITGVRSTKDPVLTDNRTFKFEAPSKKEANMARNAIWEINRGAYASVSKV